ncbi:MAG: DUF3341 domain-containing protein [Planctomycetia bacterium]|nr:DUF3341 domain-containing protein [Planctomycetia bacterium]
MSRRVLVVAFDDEHRLLAALRHARATPHEVLDVHAPYPVHGLPELLGERPSRLPWACLAGGLAGLGLGWALQVWTSVHDWPLNVGGKPHDSAPAFVPVAFELTILLAGLGVVAAFFLAERRRSPAPAAACAVRATDDRFVVSIGARDATFDGPALARRFREEFGACEVEEILVEDAT